MKNVDYVRKVFRVTKCDVVCQTLVHGSTENRTIPFVYMGQRKETPNFIRKIMDVFEESNEGAHAIDVQNIQRCSMICKMDKTKFIENSNVDYVITEEKDTEND